MFYNNFGMFAFGIFHLIFKIFLFVFYCLCSLQHSPLHSPLHSHSHFVRFLLRRMRNLGLFSYIFLRVYVYVCVCVRLIFYNFCFAYSFCWWIAASIQCQSYRCCLFRFRESAVPFSSVRTTLFSYFYCPAPCAHSVQHCLQAICGILFIVHFGICVSLVLHTKSNFTLLELMKVLIQSFCL